MLISTGTCGNFLPERGVADSVSETAKVTCGWPNGEAEAAQSCFISTRNSPEDDNFNGTVCRVSLQNMDWSRVSMTAPSVLSNVFDRRKGVVPGTTATFSFSEPIGITNANSLCKVA